MRRRLRDTFDVIWMLDGVIVGGLVALMAWLVGRRGSPAVVSFTALAATAAVICAVMYLLIFPSG